MDFRPSFSRQCGEEDYGSWHLSDLKVGRGAGGEGPLCLAIPPPPARPQEPDLPDGFPEPRRPRTSSPSAGFSGRLVGPGLLRAWVCSRAQGTAGPDPTAEPVRLGSGSRRKMGGQHSACIVYYPMPHWGMGQPHPIISSTQMFLEQIMGQSH